jgi:hypothetical protein
MIHVVHCVEWFEPGSSQCHNAGCWSLWDLESANKCVIIFSEETVIWEVVCESISELESEWWETWDDVLAETIVVTSCYFLIIADQSFHWFQVVDQTCISLRWDDQWVNFIVKVYPLDFVGGKHLVDQFKTSVIECIYWYQVLVGWSEVQCVAIKISSKQFRIQRPNDKLSFLSRVLWDNYTKLSWWRYDEGFS